MNRPDPELLQIFAAEQAEHVRRMRSIVETLAGPSPVAPAIDELMRHAHTLKGASRAAGFEPTEMLTHVMESLFGRIRAGHIAPSSHIQSLLYRTLDTVEDILASVLAGRAVPETDALIREIEGTMGISVPIAPSAPAAPASKIREDEAPGPAEFVRINATYLDELMSASSELVASTADVDSDPEPVLQAEDAMREWSRLRQDAAPYLRKKRREPEFGPVLDCIEGAERQLRNLVAEVRSESASRRRREWSLHRLADRLDETAFRVRMVSADTVFGQFGPMLRNLAHESQKQVEFRAEGLELPADRLVLQSLKDPVMHLLRNALSHGIETESERIAAGKPASGTIRLRIRSQGARLKVVVQDDGRGLDRRALIQEALRQGVVPEGGAPSDKQLSDLIFLPGFSTSSALTTLAGRGMGLSVVRHEVARLHGEVRVHSEPGKGTAITVTVPLSISSQHVLLVEAAGFSFGIITSFADGLFRVKKSEIQSFEGKPAIVVDSAPIPLFRLADALELPANGADGSEILQVVVIATGDRKAALVVDRLIDVRDVVIKSVGLPASSAGLSSGAVPLADGTVAVILSVPDLLDRLRDVRLASADPFVPEPEPERPRSILVVDDSLTTRSLEKSLLEAHGYQVHVAVDGIDALEKLRTETIDLVITDIMMPRMDGFQLLEQIRKNKASRELPVIVVSSMESREDQERGLSLGADAYIVKRKFDQRDLLDTVRQIL